MSKLVAKIKGLYLYEYLKAHFLKWMVSRNPEAEVDRVYYKVFHRHCDLDNPKDLIEKIFWLELYSDTSMWTQCADKYRIREYVEECGLSEYMPLLYGHWDTAEEIDFNALPNSFVIKANNGCGSVKVVTDKSKENLTKLKKEIKKWLKIPFGYASAQLHYIGIKPCLIAEEVLHNDYLDISPGSLVDFKVYCINGVPKFIWTPFNRYNVNNVNMLCYDTNWTPKPEYLVNSATDIYDSSKSIEKPVCLDEMLELARRLSKPFPQVRVDFYIVNGRPVIGEMTFTQGYGFLSQKVYRELGDLIDLSKIKRIK